MQKNESLVLHLSVGVVANVLAFYLTTWLGNRTFGGPSVSLALQLVIWAAALGSSIWCIDWLIRRADRWLSNRYFRRAQPSRLSLRAKRLHLTAQWFVLYSRDNVEDSRAFYNVKRKNFERRYEEFAKELKDTYNVILPDYSDPNGAGKALLKGAEALDEIHEKQNERRLLRFLPSNLTIKPKR